MTATTPASRTLTSATPNQRPVQPPQATDENSTAQQPTAQQPPEQAQATAQKRSPTRIHSGTRIHAADTSESQSGSQAQSLPHAPLTGRRLVDLTRYYAGELRAGRLGPVQYGHPDDQTQRWHIRVHADERVDVWLISWLPTQGTRLHDHGGSAGAFTVVRGRLDEAVWARGPGALTHRNHAVGTSVAFGPDRVHDVANLGDEPAVSIHAYSRPLARMTFYDVTAARLVPVSVLDTTDPEPADGPV